MLRSRREEALNRFEQATELPLLILAAAMVPLLVLPLVVDLPHGAAATFAGLDWLIWGVFAFEYLVRLALTPAKRRFILRQWPDLLIVVLPFLRPLRVVRSARALRLLRLTRLVSFLVEAGQEAARLLVRHRLHYALLASMIAVVGAASLALVVEEGAPHASITTFGDALWWSISTVTTVGYGDVFPTTAAGRGLSVFLMLVGIGLVSILTANIAAFFLEPSAAAPGAAAPSAAAPGAAAPTAADSAPASDAGAPDQHMAELLDRLERIEARLNELGPAPR